VKKESSKMPKTFCTLAWNQIHVTPIGVVKPCCIFDGPLLNEDKKSIRINDDKIEAIWNSSAFKELRLKMLRGEEIHECKKCYEEEKVSNLSDRTRALESYGHLKEIIDASFLDGNVSVLPNILNLKIGNKCNLKCRMCQPLDSAMVDEEFSQISKLDPRFRSFDNANAFDYNYEDSPISIAGDWIHNELAKNNILRLLSNTDLLSLAGGETTFTQEAIDILKFCVENNLASKMKIIMSSNLTRISDDLIDLMSKFKSFNVIASIDGVGNLAEYIRYPTKWNIVKNNFIKLVNSPSNIIPIVAPTVQIYNILNLVEIFDFIEEIPSNKLINSKHLPCHLTLLFDPQHLSIRHLPKKIKDLSLDRLLKFKARSKFLVETDGFIEQFNLIIDTLKQENFELGSETTSKDYLAYFLQYTEELDKQRHQRLQDFIPELYKLLSEENITPRYPKEDPRNYTYYRFRDTGFKLYSENKINEALEMFMKAYEMYKLDPDLLYSVALCFQQISNKEMAYSFLYQVEDIAPDNGHALKDIGILLMEDKKYQEALSYFNRAASFLGESDNDYIKKLISESNNLLR
jgi:MoaA/NifB/PqqE/SkfB family radical SAM enzyme